MTIGLKRRSVLRLYFTLLEVLVVITILCLGATLTGIKLKEAYQEQRFLSNVSQVTSLLRTAQDLMLLMDTDVHFKMKWNDDQNAFEAWLEAEKSLTHLPFAKNTKESKKDLNFRKQLLSSIVSYNYKGHSGDQQTSDDKKELDLLFSFGSSSQGLLTLSPLKKNDSSEDHFHNDYQIDLVNYPRPIESHVMRKNENEPEDIMKESQKLYPEGVDN